MSTDRPFDNTIRTLLNVVGINKDNSNLEEYVKFTKKLVRDVGFYSIFPIVIGVFLGYAYSGSLLNSQIYLYGFLVVLFLFALYSLYSGMQVSSDSALNIAKVAIFMFFFIIIITNIPKFSKSTSLMFNYAISIVLTIIAIFALAIIYYVLKNELEKLTGISGIIVNFIFYIPCLVIEFVEYLKREFALTPNVVFIMFIFQMIFILLYFYAEKLIDMITLKSKTVVLNKPVFLNKKTTILSNNKNNNFLTNKTSFNNEYVDSNSSENKLINNYYSISFWLYVTPSSINRANLNIFNYADGKPQLIINNNKFIVYCTNVPEDASQREQTTLDVLFQKWNHFVFNYYDNNCDVFVNGTLTRSFKFKDNIPKSDIMKDDKFILGEDDGVDGSICNIQFYSSNLSETQITRLYNKSVFLNLPLSK